MATNITSTDAFIFSRRNAIGEDVYLKTTSGQMSEYFRGVYSQELDTIIAEVERIEQESDESDTLINNRIDAYADRVRIVAGNTLPIVADGYWAYRIDINSLSTFKYNYNACVNGFDQIDPIIDPPDEEECLDKHALKFYENLLNEPTKDKDGGFYVLTQQADQKINRVTHIYISNEPLNTPQYNSTGSINWELGVLEDDVIQLATTTRTATGAVIVDDEHYGMFRVISVTNLPTLDGSEPFSMLKVEHIGGPSVSFVPLTGYQVKVMKSLGATISEDFVQKAGDTMTGPLNIDAATVDNPRTFFNKGEAQTYDLTLGASGVDSTIKTLGDGATKLSVESASFFITTTEDQNSQIRITDTGVTVFNVASYNTDVTLTSSTNITHKGYVDGRDATLDEKINQTNERIDNISDVLEKQSYNMKFVTEAWTGANTTNLEQWFSVTSGQIQSNANYPNNQTVYPKPAFEHKDDSTGAITPLEVDKINALLVSSEALDGLATFEVNDQDIIELQLVTDDVNTSPQIVRYIAKAFDLNTGTAASRKEFVDSEAMFLINLYGDPTYLGDANVIENATYIVKQFPRNQGISIEDADQRYLLKVGNDTKSGTLVITNANDVDNPHKVLRFVDEGSSQGVLEVDSAGDVEFLGSKVTFKNDPVSQNQSSNVIIDYEGIDFDSPSALLKRRGDVKISIGATATDFHNNRLQGALKVAESDPDNNVATLGWIREHLYSRFIAGTGIEIEKISDNNKIKITQANSRLQELDDVVAPSGLSGGETLTYDGSANKWVVTSVANLLRGKSFMGTSEQDTNVGGIWTDGTNFYLRVD